MLDLKLPDEDESTGPDESGEYDESEQNGKALKVAIDSGDGTAICEAVKRIIG